MPKASTFAPAFESDSNANDIMKPGILIISYRIKEQYLTLIMH